MSFTAVPEVEGGASAEVRLDSNPSFGVAAGVRFNDDSLVEFRWTRQDTQLRITGAVNVPRQRVLLDQYHFDFTYEYAIRDWPAWVRPYVMGGLGATRLTSTVNTVGFTRFSFGLGGGIKAFPSHHFGIKAHGQWLPLWITPEVRAFCSVGCVVHIDGQLASQFEFSVGPIVRF
jgi:hypothetical protein